MGSSPAFAKELLEHGVDWLQFGCDFHHMIDNDNVDRTWAEVRAAR